MTTSKDIPRHIAIIMDGNGRWAKQRFMPRLAGHRAGAEATREVVKNCAKRKIEVLSLFAFSSENWRRPSKEVDYLLELFLTGLERESNLFDEYNIQLRFIGNRTRFNEKLNNKIAEVEKLTSHHTGMRLLIAADYGGQWDIQQAISKLIQDVEAGILSSKDIQPEHIRSKLSFADLPDPDLFIRTSGELRLSNFMLWQLAYSELYFTNTLWPDFNEEELNKALAHYVERERRYGYSSEQLKMQAKEAD